MSQKFAVMIAYDDDPNVKRYSPDFQTQDEFAKGWQSALKKGTPHLRSKISHHLRMSWKRRKATLCSCFTER